MKKFILNATYTVLVLGFAWVGQVMAQTPDGETPANEGVCDELFGGTPGLYGLCVGFCEAQDCEATVDPDGNVVFDASCKKSSTRLLENYIKRSGPGDPPMPCINTLENECPCWTVEELAFIADGADALVHHYDVRRLRRRDRGR